MAEQITQADREPQDAHVRLASKLFRDCGFTLDALQFPRPPEALVGLKRFNGLSEDARAPVAWHYFPNAYMRDNWRCHYGLKITEIDNG